MPSRDALSRCGGELGPWLYSSTSPAWIESSMRFSVVLTRTGKPTPSNYLHRQLDVTFLCPFLARASASRYSVFNMDEQEFQKRCDVAFESLLRRLQEVGDERG